MEGEEVAGLPSPFEMLKNGGPRYEYIRFGKRGG